MTDRGDVKSACNQATVRIRCEVIPFLDELVMDAKDEFGIPIFSSRQEVVTEAVRELLRKYKPKAQMNGIGVS